MGARKAKARDERAVGEAGEEVAALLVGAVADEELARAERVGHGDRRVRVEAVRAELGEDRGDGHRREAEAAPLLRDLHREEALVAHVVPRLARHVLVGRDRVVVEQRAQLLDLVVEEGLLLGRELRRVRVEQVLQRRAAAEDVAVEADLMEAREGEANFGVSFE